MKKIAFISELYGSPKQGGENIAMFRSSQALSKFGIDVDFYSYSGENSKKIETRIPIKLLSLPFVRDLLFCPWIGLKVFRKIRGKYDCILIASPMLVCLANPRTKLIIICHAIRTQKTYTLSSLRGIKYRVAFNPITRRLFRKIESSAFQKASSIVVLKEEQKNFLIRNMSVSPNKVKVIPNSIDLNTFRPNKSPKKNQIIFVGRATFPKGFDLIVSAANLIKADILIATQKADPELLDKASSRPNMKVIFNVRQQKLVQLYSESKLFILPSRDEEQPLTILEAMACGLPVIVSENAASNIVENKTNGYVLGHGFSPEELASTCNQLLGNEEKLSIIGVANRLKIQENYSVNKRTKELLRCVFQS